MDMQQATDALGRQFSGTTPYVAQQAGGFAHQPPQETRAGAVKAPGNSTPAERDKRFARMRLEDAKQARLAGDPRRAHYALQEATSARGSAQDALGIKPGKRVFQRPNAFAHFDLQATRRLP